MGAVVRLLLALQAFLGASTENGTLQTKTPGIHLKGFRSVTTAEALLNQDVYQVSFVEGGEPLRETGGRFSDAAARFNRHRANYLECLADEVPGRLRDFMSRHGLE